MTPIPPQSTPELCLVDIALIVESLTNPRKHFDAAALQELAGSIAATGVHQPVLLRLLPADHEPDGWPAVQTWKITALLDEIDRLRGAQSAAIRDVQAEVERKKLNPYILAIPENISADDFVRADMVEAAALFCAAIERLDRAQKGGAS